jgi:metallo-beta-lactamase family protein
MEDWPVALGAIHYVLLTHAHVDHVGNLPRLIEAGFEGKILATHPTKALLLPILKDAMSFSHKGEKHADQMVEAIDRLSWGFEYGEECELKHGIRFVFRQAGHILGSAFILLKGANPAWSILFSGDLGPRNTPLLPDPDPPPECDLLVLEATYGDRVHEGREHRIERLGQILARALADGGKVYVPAFALGRTQELLYELDRLFSDPSIQRNIPGLSRLRRIPVFVDSPLGLELTKITSGLSAYWDREATELLKKGDHPLDFDNLYAVGSHKEHLRLLEMPGPAIIIAGSGRCTGGRILDHLKEGLDDPRNDILFVGYQAAGTPGRTIQEYAAKPDGYVLLEGNHAPALRIRAGVHVLGGYSAHADQRELIDWVRAMPAKPGQIRVVHGEAAARKALGDRIAKLGEW